MGRRRGVDGPKDVRLAAPDALVEPPPAFTWQQAENPRLNRNGLRYNTRLIAPHLEDLYGSDVALSAAGAGSLVFSLPFHIMIKKIINRNIARGTHHDPAMAKVMRDFICVIVPNANPSNLAALVIKRLARAGPDRFFSTLGEGGKLSPQTRHVVEHFFDLVRFVRELSKNAEALEVIWANAPNAPPLTDLDVYEMVPTCFCPDPNAPSFDLRRCLQRVKGRFRQAFRADYTQPAAAAAVACALIGLAGALAWLVPATHIATWLCVGAVAVGAVALLAFIGERAGIKHKRLAAG